MSQINISKASECLGGVSAPISVIQTDIQTNRPQAVHASATSGSLWEKLFQNLDYSFDAVYTVIENILTAKDRCQISPLYVQGVVTPSTTFLVSNIVRRSELCLTTVNTCWRLGRSADCALPIDHPAVDSCHAAIDYATGTGFRLTDLGSTSGLRHNRYRLPSLGKRLLRDGDLIELGTLRIEFFIDDFRTDTQTAHPGASQPAPQF